MALPATAIAIPTLRGGSLLAACLAALDRQTDHDFEVIVIDNTGTGAVARELEHHSFSFPLRVLRNPDNLGFAASVNAAWQTSTAPFLATLNDDAEPHPEWLAELRRAIATRREVGMCASRVVLHGTTELDSAGMLVAADASSKQRGHGRPSAEFAREEAVLFPSGSAALYRREMLDDIGLFDPDFFLYCEDTDLGLRARWNGWECLYVPQAIAEHHYSRSAGAASSLKVWHVERNRLWVAAKNFPLRMLLAVPFYTASRYFWHFAYSLAGKGTAAHFRRSGQSTWKLLGIVVRAHLSVVSNFRTLLEKRRQIRRAALMNDKQFASLLKRHRITAREIARL